MTIPVSSEEEVFLGALEQDTPARRATYLDRVCVGNAKLRGRIEQLLALHEQPHGPLDALPQIVLSAAPHVPAVETGASIGPYTLRRPIGEGGMGLVYMAEQTHPVQRNVALKIIKPGMDTHKVIQRFETERQALALMDHPHIARVFDAGATEGGLPYFVMELVEGVPITDYCDKHRLTIEERLDLFAPVCRAVQHAHQKGIIHRDLKPSNILVAEYDDRSAPKVIDFGVAKAIGGRLSENTGFTEFGQIVGTIEYMSPEQARLDQLDIDIRSDIYSLGVLLYELLTGETPFGRGRLHEAGLDEALRMVREEDPPAPSVRLGAGGNVSVVAAHRGAEPRKLMASVRGEIDWIVMKCLEKDRNRRYDTAGALLMDLERYLSHEPVLACPPSALYRLQKFVRRNKGPVLAAAAVLIVLVGGIIGTTIGMVRAQAAQRDAITAQQAESERAEGERKAKLAAVTRETEVKAVLEFVESRIFAAARPDGQDGGLGHDVSLRQAVEAALPYLEGSFPKQPLIEARLRATLRQSFLYLGEAKVAAKMYETARSLYSQHAGANHRDTLRCVLGLANSLSALGRRAEALKLREEMAAASKRVFGPDHVTTLLSLNNLANSYALLGREAEALELREKVLARMKATLGPRHLDTLTAMSSLANSYQALGRYADARLLREEIGASKKAGLGADHPDTLMTMNQLANTYKSLRQYESAVQLHEKTLALRKSKLGLDHPDALMSMNNLANTYRALGRHEKALELHEKTFEARKVRLGSDHPDTLMSAVNLANSFSRLRRNADALKLREETLPRVKARLGADHPYTIACMNNLANSYDRLGRRAESLKLRRQTLALREKKLGPKHPETLVTMWAIAENLAKLGRIAESIPIIDECLQRAAGQVVHPQMTIALLRMRLFYFAKRKDEAGCLQTVKMWECLKRTDAVGLYQSACMRAVTASVYASAESQEGAQKARTQANRAMDWLRKAVSAGFRDLDLLKKDSYLQPLRNREDFKNLIAELQDEAAPRNE